LRFALIIIYDVTETITYFSFMFDFILLVMELLFVTCLMNIYA